MFRTAFLILLVVLPHSGWSGTGPVTESSVSESEALELARHSILNDLEDIESPLVLLLEFYESQGLDSNTPEVLNKAQEQLTQWLAQPSSSFSLVPIQDCELPQVIPCPENRESLEKNWVYYFTFPEFSDHNTWTVVDRSGVAPTYTYGFN